MNFILFIHGKASAGKDSFIKALKINYYKYTLRDVRPDNFLYKDNAFENEMQFLYDEKPSAFDTPAIETISFNEGVYQELARINPEVDLLRLKTDYEYKSRYRKDLIRIGDGYRQENPEIWIEKHCENLEERLKVSDDQIFICPSMRYRNELEYSKFLNTKDNLISFSVKIEASLGTRLNRMSSEGIANYMKFAKENASETDLDSTPDSEFDFYIRNEENFEPENYILMLNEFVFWKEQERFFNIFSKFQRKSI